MATMPVDVYDLLVRWEAKFGLPAVSEDLDATNARAREWTRRFCEQCAFTFPDRGYGHKSAGNGRPPSTDVLARRTGNEFVGWDLIISQGTPIQRLVDGPPHTIDLTGQTFIIVPPVNHLGEVADHPSPSPSPAPEPDNGLIDAVRELSSEVANLTRVVQDAHALASSAASAANEAANAAVSAASAAEAATRRIEQLAERLTNPGMQIEVAAGWARMHGWGKIAPLPKV